MDIKVYENNRHAFRHNERVMLVERIDIPGALGVAMQGGRFVCPLPLGYDMQTSVTYHKGYVLVAHPLLSPLLCDTLTGEVKRIDSQHIAAEPGKFRLMTR